MIMSASNLSSASSTEQALQRRHHALARGLVLLHVLLQQSQAAARVRGALGGRSPRPTVGTRDGSGGCSRDEKAELQTILAIYADSA